METWSIQNEREETKRTGAAEWRNRSVSSPESERAGPEGSRPQEKSGGTVVNELSFPSRVATAKALLEEVAEEHDEIPADQMVYLLEAIEFLDRLERSFRDGRTHE